MAHGHEAARMVEREANQRPGRTSQHVGLECDEVTVCFDVEIDNLLRRLLTAATSQGNQEWREHHEKQAPPCNRRITA